MRHSLVINTACGDPLTAGKRNPYRSARYGERVELLREILSAQRHRPWAEVIVAGTFSGNLPEEFPEVHWIALSPQRHNRWDGLYQRDMGARFATGDTITFCHDDHLPSDDYAARLDDEMEGVDILVPDRIHNETGAKLNNGKADGYMGGHCYTMRRWIWAILPLTTAPDEWWDIWLTPRWLELGAKMRYTSDLWHFDLEATAEEL